MSSQGKEEKKNVLHNRTFSTPFSESLTNGQTSRKRVGNGLEDFSFYRRVASFLALNLIGSDRKRVKMLTNNNHIQGREGGKKQKK